MTREERALPLIECISEAALDSAAWQEFVKRLSDDCRGAAVRLAFSLPAEESFRCYEVGLQDEYRDTFLADMMGGLPWEPEAVVRYTEGFCLLGDLFPGVELRRQHFYQQWLRPQKLAAVWPIGAPILGDDGMPVGGLSLFRPAGGRAFSREDVELGRVLMPHVQRAVRVSALLAGVKQQQHAFAEVMDRLPTGVLLLDAQRQPVVTNRSAERILALDDGIRVGPNGPYAAKPSDNKALRDLLDAAITTPVGHEAESGGFIAVERPSGRRQFVVMVSSLFSATEDSGNSAAVVMFIADPEAGDVSATEVLGTVYDLTQAEAELVQLLSRGYSVEESAEMRGVTLNTVRSQLKHVFAKTDTKRQGELVRLILTGVAAVRER